MKTLFSVSVMGILFLAFPAHALELCEERQPRQSDESLRARKVREVSGEEAKQIWEQLDVSEQTPRAKIRESRTRSFFPKVKYSTNVTCYKYQPADPEDETESKPLDCEVYICHVSEVSGSDYK